MSAPGKSPPTTSPSGSASPPEGGACLSSPFRPSFRHPGQGEAATRDRRAEGLTKALPNAPTTAVALRSRIFGLRPRPGRRGERSVQPTSAEGANGSRLSGFACGRDDVLRGRHDLTSPRPSPRPSAARAGAYWLPERPRGHRNLSRVLRTPRSPPRHPTRRPLLSSSRARRSRDPGPASRGPMGCAPDHPHDRGGSPVPALRLRLRPEGRRSEKTPENAPTRPAGREMPRRASPARGRRSGTSGRAFPRWCC